MNPNQLGAAEAARLIAAGKLTAEARSMLKRAAANKPMRVAGAISALTAMLAALPPGSAPAQSWPMKPIRMVVGFGPGGAADVTARSLGQRLAESLGQPIVVENRPGAGSSIGTERVVTSPPDGYTLLMMSSGAAVQAAVRSDLPFRLERDLAPVSLVVTGTNILVVHPSVPARSVKELIGLARSRPGILNFGSGGVITSSHLAGELFKLMARVSIEHVPYKGGAEQVTATISGQIDMSFPNITGALPALGANRLRALGVTRKAKRSALLPAVPTLSEAGLPDYDYVAWYGVLAPAGTPRDVIARLHAAIVRAVDAPQLKASLEKQGLDPDTNTPEQFATLVRNEIAQTAKLIKSTGLKLK